MSKADIHGKREGGLLDLTSMQLLERAVAEAPDRIGLKQPKFGDQPEIAWTYAEFLADARRIAMFLSKTFKHGDHVATWTPNCVQWFLYQFAAAHLGLVIITLNPALRHKELEYMLAKSRAKGIIMDRVYRDNNMVEQLELVRASLPEIETVLYIDEWRLHLQQGEGELPLSTTKPADPAFIVFTSGTTGRPKGAVLSHYACVNNAALGAMRTGQQRGSVWLTTLPVFAVGAPVTNCLGAISLANTQVIMPPFEAGMMLQIIEQERITFMPLVPAMAIPIVEHPTFPDRDISSLTSIMVGGTIITPSFVETTREKLGCDIQNIYGQTELAAEVCKTARGDPDEFIMNTVGTPLPYTDLRIMDLATEEVCDRNVVGEIRVKSPFATNGYFGDEVATAQLFDPDGYLRTGDLGLVDDDGNVRISGRLKEVIIRGGANIYPREVEDVLCEFPGIAEAAVVGLEHPRWGEEVAAAIRVRQGAVIDIEDVKAFLLARVSRYKVPKHWLVVGDFPRNAAGKIQKFRVGELFDPVA
jgi:fatty-acyl-CoA synthase